jgi:CDP-diacylglycerol--glycerol-3-phosphate 3-phosphatidyltransferase
MNLPTKITFSRIIATIVLIITLFVLSFFKDLVTPLLGNSKINLIFLVIFVFFVIASYTDHLDGKLARKNNQVTDLGKFLDPVADKLLVSSMLIFLTAPNLFAPYTSGEPQTLFIPVWCVIIMVARDTVVDALRFIAAQKKVVIAANIFGKLKTVLQMVAIGAVLLNDFPFHYMYSNNNNPYLTVTMFLVYLATLASLLSGIIYVIQNRKVFLEEKKEEK